MKLHLRLREHLRKNDIDMDGTTLLAVSGGGDSVAMAQLFKEARYPFAIAHCNFGLRSEDSEGDEAFVRALAASWDVPFHTTRIATNKREGLSLQMVARERRYAWLEETRATHGYSYIATAHHKEDVIETLLLNFTKGAYLRGLGGMALQSGHLLRPLLWATKGELAEYLAISNQPFREDKSNAEVKYRRNFYRHKIIPLLEEVNPNLAATLAGSSLYRRELTAFLDKRAGALRAETLRGGFYHLPLSLLKAQGWNSAFLHFAFEKEAISYLQWQLAVAEPWPDSAKRFQSRSHSLYKENSPEPMLVLATKEPEEFSMEIPAPGRYESPYGVFVVEEISEAQPAELRRLDSAHFDLDKISFPLTLRRREAGDSFRPFGMKGRKGLSAFLQDAKAPRYQRERQLVLLSGNEIAWVVGRRIGDGFKVASLSGPILRVKWEGVS